jgi:hypothetical protein
VTDAPFPDNAVIITLDTETKTDLETIRLFGAERFEGEHVPAPLSLLEEWSDISKYFFDLYVEITDNPETEYFLLTWNGEGFDYPLLEKACMRHTARELSSLKNVTMIDGFLLSKMLHPDRYQHSLDSWAKELFPGTPKLTVDYDNADIEELAEYLARDLFLTRKVILHLTKQAARLVKEDSLAQFRAPLRCEQAVRRLVNVTRDEGIGFNLELAQKYVEVWTEELDSLEASMKDWLPSLELPPSKLDHPPKVQFKKDGTPSANLRKYLSRNGWELETGSTAEGEDVFLAVKYDKHTRGVLDLCSLPLTAPLEYKSQIKASEQGRLKEYLLSEGWEPTMWNTKWDPEKKSEIQTTPRLFDKVTRKPCPGLEKVLQPSQIKELHKYYSLRHRVNMLLGGGGKTGLIPAAKVSEHSHTMPTIHADADTCGTPTARFKHKTVVNIPRASSFKGEELRSLFCPVDKRSVQVGWDAKALEAVMEAHYVYPYDPAYALELVEGDVHQRNMDKLGLPSRDVAKTFKYAITYGAQPPTLARSLGVSLHVAERWFEEFWSLNEGLARLKADIEREGKARGQKYIIGLDGRPLFTRSRHALLNTKLQGGGAILMKYAFILSEKLIQEYLKETGPGVPCAGAYPLIRYHDEEQWEVEEWVDPVAIGKLGVQGIEKAGTYLNLRVPITGDFKIGNNWAETH